MILQEKIQAQLPEWRERIKKLAKDHSEVKVAEVNIGQIVGGMRDIKSLLTDVSFVDPAEGIRFRGLSIPEVLKSLPHPGDLLRGFAGAGRPPGAVRLLRPPEQALEVEAE